MRFTSAGRTVSTALCVLPRLYRKRFATNVDGLEGKRGKPWIATRDEEYRRQVSMLLPVPKRK